MPLRAVFEAEAWRLTAPATDLVFGAGRLRRWQSTDAADLVAAWSDDEIARWNDVPARPTDELALAWISGWNQRLANGHALDLAIDTEHGIAGEVGIAGINTARRAGLIGYWTAKTHRHQGVAAAAVEALVTWAFADGGFALLVARCDQANIASQRTAARAGFVYQMTEPNGPQLWSRRA